jgi:TonB family protein
MVMSGPSRRLVAVIVATLAAPSLAAAQIVPSTEAQLLAQVDRQPSQLAGYLDLAKLYFEQRRLDDAQAMLARAAALVQQERAAAAASGGAALRVGGDIKPPTKIWDVSAVYPPIAQSARVGGIVIVEAILGTDGHVKDVKILRSEPLLDQAALDAVRQWRYTPTLRNGVPVEVVLTTTVTFSPDQPPAATPPVRVGGDIKPPQLVKRVNPVYPDDAREAKLTGVVLIEAVIDTQGHVRNPRVLRSVAPSLDQAALEAVRQWEYAPTLLSGVPVEVVFTVTVVFTLK